MPPPSHTAELEINLSRLDESHYGVELRSRPADSDTVMAAVRGTTTFDLPAIQAAEWDGPDVAGQVLTEVIARNNAVTFTAFLDGIDALIPEGTDIHVVLDNGSSHTAKHTKDCLLMPECIKSCYGVLTYDKKVYKFDKAGNAEAKKFIHSLKKEKDIKVDVTGTVTGETMTVTKIELQ